MLILNQNINIFYIHRYCYARNPLRAHFSLVFGSAHIEIRGHNKTRLMKKKISSLGIWYREVLNIHTSERLGGSTFNLQVIYVETAARR